MNRLKTVVAFVLIALMLSACGQPAASNGGDATASAPATSGMLGMEPNVVASAPSAAPTASATAEMAHPAMGSASSEGPYDARFIDSMIEHHTGAITMAEQALGKSERPDISTLAQAIIDTQRQEVEQMKQWRTAWYAELAPTDGLGMHMGAMSVSGDTTIPFDQRFLTAMISHHQGAIEMAQDAEQNAEHSQIKDLARTIVSAQKAEIREMQQQQQDWFGR